MTITSTRTARPTIATLETIFHRQTIVPPKSLLASPVTPIHTLDRGGRCVFCQEQPKAFFDRNWREYVEKHGGNPPMTKGEWMYYRTSCLEMEGWTAPHPSQPIEVGDIPRTF